MKIAEIKIADCVMVAFIAFSTAALTRALWDAMPRVVAGDSPANKIAQPVLETDGVRLAVKVSRPTGKKGGEPAIVLNAVNTEARAVTVRATVSLLTVTPVSPIARTIPSPKKIWSREYDIALKPGETRRIELPPAVKVGSGSTATFTVRAGGKSFTVPHPLALKAPLATIATATQRDEQEKQG
jgi:hypothetical protein